MARSSADETGAPTKWALRRNVQMWKSVIWGVNGVAVARHGPILKDNEATGSRNVFKYIPGLRDTTTKSKMAAKVQQSKNTVFYYIFLYRLFGVSRWCHAKVSDCHGEQGMHLNATCHTILGLGRAQPPRPRVEHP